MKGNTSIWLLFVALMWITGCMNTKDDAVIEIDTDIVQEMEVQGIPSVVACVVKDNEIVWEGVYGFADISQNEPATRQTLYTLMSISKLFIATSVMQLWEEGSLDLDSDINDYLPFAVRNPHYPDRKITPLMLLTHTSGLAWPDPDEGIPSFYFFYPHENVPLISDWLPQYIIPGGTQYVSQVWKDFPPGEMELYSNIGSSLLALIVENVTGEDYRDYCQEQILEPLEMNNSAFRLTHLNEELLAAPYFNPGSAMDQYTYRHYPAGNLKSNLEDFSHFIMAILNKGIYHGNRIMESTTVDRMFELQNPVTGTSLLWSNCPGDCIGHSGGGTGFSLRAEWYPGQNKGMFIFSNMVNKSVLPHGRIYELVKYQSSLY